MSNTSSSNAQAQPRASQRKIQRGYGAHANGRSSNGRSSRNGSGNNASQLIQTLQALTMLDSSMPHPQFVATLSRLIDFSDAISLSDFLADLPRIKAKTAGSADVDTNTGDQARARYIETRGEVISRIHHSFAPHYRPKPVRLPKLGEHDSFNDQRDAYLRFYALYQSELEASIIRLAHLTRQDLSAHSPAMAQLAALDQKLQEILSSYSRKALAALPTLLSKRFVHHCAAMMEQQAENKPQSNAEGSDNHDKSENPNKSENTASPENGLTLFLSEMQQLLLAEWEIRLQPTLGLLEALTLAENALDQSSPTTVKETT